MELLLSIETLVKKITGGVSYAYRGLGYKIAVCNDKDTIEIDGIKCKKEVNFAPFKIF